MPDKALDPKKTAMLFFDTYNAALHPKDPARAARAAQWCVIPKLQRINQAGRAAGINEVSAILEKGIAVGRMTDGEALEARKRLRAVISLEEAARGAALVIEAVPERIELKVELFAQLDRVAPPHAILATN